jgi:hypothetical protein
VAILVAWGGDGWLTRRWEFGRRGHAGAEQGGLGEDGPDMWVSSVSDGGAVMGWQAGSRVEMGRGRCRVGPAAEKTAHDGFFHLTFQAGEKIKYK